MTEKKKGVSSTPWDKIKSEYMAGASLSELGRKYDLSPSTICKKGKRDGWQKAREKIAKESQKKVTKIVSDGCAEIAALYMDSILTLSKKMNAGIKKLEDTDFVAQKQYMSCLKDLKEIGIYKSDLDRAEQMARIEKLKKETEQQDKEDSKVVVEFKGGIDGYNC